MNPRGWRLAVAVAVVVIPVFLAISAWAGTVTNLNDSGGGSLRQAIADASPGETIDFAVTGTITLTSGHLAIDKDLTITGPGESQLTISGNNNSRVFYIGTFTVTLSGLTIAEGYTEGNAGGIFNLAGTLTLTNCTVRDNDADAASGGIYNLFGTLTLTNCTVRDNNAYGSYGGGIYNLGGTLTLTNCTVSGNTAGNDGGGVDNYDGNATLANCTVSGNTAIGHRGGGIEHYEGTMTLTNCTVSGNTAAIGGGIHDFYQTTTLTNCTVSGNTAIVGGGIAAESEGVVSFKNTIIANNSGTSGAPDCWVDPIGTYTLKSYGFSLVEDTSGCRIAEEANPGTDITGQDPNLGPLQNNGGPTETQALLEGSPAIDAALDCTLLDGTTPVTEDQRGVSRPQGSECDMGAFEDGPAEMTVLGLNNAVILNGDTTPSIGDGTDFGKSVANGWQVTRTFTISNSGGAALNLTGTPLVTITGPDAEHFSLVVYPTTPVAPLGTTTFQVRFTASELGTRMATLTINSDDSDENPYSFDIQGTGVEQDFNPALMAAIMVAVHCSPRTGGDMLASPSKKKKDSDEWHAVQSKDDNRDFE